MRLYTKTGDDGKTGLIGGQRVSKDDVRVAAYGDVDELNAAMGLAIAACTDEPLAQKMRLVQDQLFQLGAELSNPVPRTAPSTINTALAALLESWIDQATSAVTPLKQFVLPGGTELAARLHLARTVCRRAERSLVHLAAQQPVNPSALVYLNRLSDLLFAWARLANHLAGVPDVPWNAPKST